METTTWTHQRAVTSLFFVESDLRMFLLQVQVLQMEGGPVNDDSYVETPYYDELNKVDKILHHKVVLIFLRCRSFKLLLFLFEVQRSLSRICSSLDKALGMNLNVHEFVSHPPSYVFPSHGNKMDFVVHI